MRSSLFYFILKRNSECFVIKPARCMVNRLFETKSFVSNFASFSKRYCSGSSHQRCSVKKDVLETFANFTGKNLCWNFFLITLPQPATLLKKKLCYRCFSEKFANSLRTPFFFTEHLRATASIVRWFLPHFPYFTNNSFMTEAVII